MYRAILGINGGAPGYKHIVIRPVPGGGIEWAKGHYDSIRGRIAVDWKRVDGAFSLDVTIPPNTSASVYLPATAGNDVLESGMPVREVAGVKSVTAGPSGVLIVEVDSGTYSFVSK